MLTNQETIDRGFETLRSLMVEDPDLRSEFERSRAEFFRTGDPDGPSVEDTLALRRHLEWFLLERPSLHHGVLPFEVLLARADARAPALAEDRAQTFLGSHCSVFEVTGVQPGEGLWIRDLASYGEHAILEREASQLLRVGDLIVGRVFPVGDSLHHISRAATFYRNPELLAALRADLDRVRQARRGVLRLTQSEIESMFYAARSEDRPVDAVGDARTLLLDGGLGREDVDEILERLASEPYSAEAVLPGAQDILGEVLDRLAFESTIDLEAARQALLQAWAELSRSGPGRGASLPVSMPTASVPEPVNITQAVAEYERRRSLGASPERSLLELEKALGLTEGSEIVDEPETPAPDFPGVVGAVIEEFLWETQLSAGPDRVREMECLRSFGRFANSIGVFENLSSAELREYTCRWLPESDELESADSARRMLSALQMFCRWAEANHGVLLYSDFKTTLQSLQDALPRLTEANRRRTRQADPARGELFECLSLDAASEALVRDRAGHELRVRIESELGTWLQAGDRLRGSVLPDGRIAVYCCYPADSDTDRQVN